MGQLEFFIDLPFRPHCDPGVDSASNKNEYHGYILVGKGGRCVGPTNLSPSCADCLQIWEPQPAGAPQGTVQGCTKVFRSFQNCLIYFIFIKTPITIKERYVCMCVWARDRSFTLTPLDSVPVTTRTQHNSTHRTACYWCACKATSRIPARRHHTNILSQYAS